MDPFANNLVEVFTITSDIPITGVFLDLRHYEGASVIWLAKPETPDTPYQAIPYENIACIRLASYKEEAALNKLNHLRDKVSTRRPQKTEVKVESPPPPQLNTVEDPDLDISESAEELRTSSDPLPVPEDKIAVHDESIKTPDPLSQIADKKIPTEEEPEEETFGLDLSSGAEHMSPAIPVNYGSGYDTLFDSNGQFAYSGPAAPPPPQAQPATGYNPNVFFEEDSPFITERVERQQKIAEEIQRQQEIEKSIPVIRFGGDE